MRQPARRVRQAAEQVFAVDLRRRLREPDCGARERERGDHEPEALHRHDYTLGRNTVEWEGTMVLTKSELIALLQKEIRLLLHLTTKIDAAALDYRPTPK